MAATAMISARDLLEREIAIFRWKPERLWGLMRETRSCSVWMESYGRSGYVPWTNSYFEKTVGVIAIRLPLCWSLTSYPQPSKIWSLLLRSKYEIMGVLWDKWQLVLRQREPIYVLMPQLPGKIFLLWSQTTPAQFVIVLTDICW